MRRLLLGFLVLCLLLLAAGLYAVAKIGYAPRSLGPYIARRGSGHAPWMENGSRWFGSELVRLDRGEQAAALGYPAWSGASAQRVFPDQGSWRERVVGDPAELLEALQQVQPGDRITLLPGRYVMKYSIRLRVAGRADAPIVVRALKLGEATLEMLGVEGFHVLAPYWRFENLRIRGICPNHGDCEHAFHIVGPAHHVVLRNNLLEDFNAQIKINGDGKDAPDDGVIEGNTLIDTVPRNVIAPVTPIDLVVANNWRIEGNLIADFIKQDGNKVSYGAFAKGAGSGNRFVRNVVLCEHRLRGWPGQRIGLSLGGGGTDKALCRDGGHCIVEQDGSEISDNLIAQCSDVGVYLNRASRSTLRNNTLFDTAGIDVRFGESTAYLSGNLVEGAVRERDGGILHDEGNRVTGAWQAFIGYHPVRSLFMDAAALDLRWRSTGVGRDGNVTGTRDLCGYSEARTVFGAFENFEDCLKH